MLTAVIGMFAQCKQIQALCALVKRAQADLQELKFKAGSVIIIALRWGDVVEYDVLWMAFKGPVHGEAFSHLFQTLTLTPLLLHHLALTFFPVSSGHAYCAFSQLEPNKWGSQQCSFKLTYQRYTRTVHTHVNSEIKAAGLSSSFINWKLPSELWPLAALCCVGRHIPVTEC